MYKCKDWQYLFLHIPYPAISKCVSTPHAIYLTNCQTVRTQKHYLSRKTMVSSVLVLVNSRYIMTVDQDKKLYYAINRSKCQGMTSVLSGVIHRFIHNRTKIEQKSLACLLTYTFWLAILETVNKTTVIYNQTSATPPHL